MMNGVQAESFKGTYREEGSGIGSGGNYRYKNGANEAKGDEDSLVSTIYKKTLGDGIGAVYKREEEDFVMVDMPLKPKNDVDVLKEDLDKLDTKIACFNLGGFSALKRYSVAVQAYANKRDFIKAGGEAKLKAKPLEIKNLKKVLAELNTQYKDCGADLSELKDSLTQNRKDHEDKMKNLVKGRDETMKALRKANNDLFVYQNGNTKNPATLSRIKGEIQKAEEKSVEINKKISKAEKSHPTDIHEKAQAEFDRIKEQREEIEAQLKEAKNELLEMENVMKVSPHILHSQLMPKRLERAFSQFLEIKKEIKRIDTERLSLGFSLKVNELKDPCRKLLKKIGKMESQYFDHLLPIMYLGADRQSSVMRGKLYLQGNRNQTLVVEAYMLTFSKSEDQRKLFQEVSEEFRRDIKNTPKKYT